MKTLGLAADPEAAKTFSDNIEALRKYDEAMASRLEALENPVSKVVEVDDDLNLDIGHTLFYEKGVRQFVDEQYEAYRNEPYRIDLGWPRTDNDPPQLMTKMAMRRLNQKIDQKKITRIRNPLEQRDVAGFAVSLGVGIGDHPGRLMNDHKVQSLIIVEQFIEFLWHSMHLHPWHEWLDVIEKRNGKLFIIIQDSPASASSELTDALRSDSGGTLDGTLIYTHYRSHLVREIHKGLSDQISYIGSNRGFFEDENIMLLNATRNFLSRDHAVWRGRPRREKPCPAFVVAAGPSVDTAIETIRKYKDQAVIISCGSGLKVMLNYGIKPHFHVEVENTFGQADILERVAGQHDLSGITLVAAATVNPRTAAVFDKVIFFHRDTVSSTRFFELMGRPIYLAVPTVSNCGVRFAIGMAFKEIYMFGVDFGSRVADYHHSKKSAYYTDTEFLYSFQGTRESTVFPYTNEGNLGGNVKTHDGFLLSRLFMQKLMKAYPGYRVYNCSDGIDIPGALPKLSETVTVTATQKNQTNALQMIENDLSHYAPGESVHLKRFHDLGEKMNRWFNGAYETLDQLKEVENPDVFESYAQIAGLFDQDPDEEFDPILAVVWQNLYGTVLTTFNQYFRVHRRVHDEDTVTVFHIYLGELTCFLEDMEQILGSVIDMLTEEVEAVSKDKALGV